MNASGSPTHQHAGDRLPPADRFLIGLAVGLVVVGLGFVLVDYAARMWRSGHYQFFPLDLQSTDAGGR